MDIKNMSRETIETNALIVINSLAYLIDKDPNKSTVLLCVDLADYDSRAVFILNKTTSEFMIFSSSFSNDDRKLEMLNILQNNKDELEEAILNA